MAQVIHRLCALLVFMIVTTSLVLVREIGTISAKTQIITAFGRMRGKLPSQAELPETTFETQTTSEIALQNVEGYDELARQLQESLEDFRYPFASAPDHLRLPDAYIYGSMAFDARRPSRRFKHLYRIYTRLFVQREPVHICILGGSNSAGSGLGKSMQEVRKTYNQSFAVRLEQWLNKHHPPKRGAHIVHNFGRGAVGSCYFQLLVEKLTDPNYIGGVPDLFILETSVNDVQSSDVTCFQGLVSKIVSTFTGTSIISLHLTNGPDFLNSCGSAAISQSYCKRNMKELEAKRNQTFRWCKKLDIVEHFGLLQIDLEVLRQMVCRRLKPFHYTKDTTEIIMHPHKYPPASRAQKRILKVIQDTDETQLAIEAPLLSLGSYNNNAAHDSEVIPNYRKPFKIVDKALAKKLGVSNTSAGNLGDLFVYSSDKLHIGRWGHLLAAAEIVSWLTWLSFSGHSAIAKESASSLKTKAHKTIWAAVSLDMQHYNERSRTAATNKHKPLHTDAVLDIYRLKPIKEANGWEYRDDTGMRKHGWITEDPHPRSISFKLPKFEKEVCGTYVIRLGYLKSYSENMAPFSVVVSDGVSQKRIVSQLKGRHELKASVLVEDIVAWFSGPNDLILNVTSQPSGEAKKVKIVGTYVSCDSG